MNRLPVLAFLLMGAGFSALVLGACSGPTAPPGDAGFGPTTGWDTGGSYGTGGSSGAGGSYGTGGFSGGTGGTSGGEERRDGGGGRRRDTPDAGTAALCPPGTMGGGPCMVAGLTCRIPAGDGGEAQICTCRMRGGASTWRCEEP
jgi:hypothetical protein